MLPEGSGSTDVTGRVSTGFEGTAETTGRWVVTFADAGDETDHAATLRSAGVSNVASSLDYEDQVLDVAQTQASDAVVFAELGVAVVSGAPTQVSAMQASAGGDIVSVEPEYVHHVLEGTGGNDYVTGYRDGVTDLSARLLSSEGAGVARGDVRQAFQDSAQFTWGLQATGVSSSPFSGKGIKVAVLDTGFNLNHPDFVGRNIASQSFIPGAATAEDGHGHGTHCIGTSCGPKNPPSSVRRYGCGYEADIFVGKVLSDQGSGDDTGILAGINWAVANRTEVISMSLGADVPQVSQAYETVGRRALNKGCLIVAAAGNNAQRDQPSLPPQQRFGFVGIPANSPSIMAVAALDEQLEIAVFSARSLTGVRGGNIDIAGPGVRVFSSWNQPRPEQGNQKYRSISGTSMATPHVAGIAALWSQARSRKGRHLWTTLTQRAERLQLPSVDVGCGLVQAPQ
jgi:subtilisin family serine protease